MREIRQLMYLMLSFIFSMGTILLFLFVYDERKIVYSEKISKRNLRRRRNWDIYLIAVIAFVLGAFTQFISEVYVFRKGAHKIKFNPKYENNNSTRTSTIPEHIFEVA